MAIWSKHSRVANALDKCICLTCKGIGQLTASKEDLERMVCGANICPACNGSGFDRSEREVSWLLKHSMEVEH
jgi:DnaJ-class molecular chaperone